MTSDDLQRQVERIASDVLGVPAAEIGPGSSPDSVVTWDSVHHLSLVLALEQEFGLEFEPDDIEGMTTVLAIVDAVERSLAGS